MASNTKGDKKALTEQDVRMFLRDYDPSLNTLLEDLEFTSDEIYSAMIRVIDRWNDTPPYVASFTPETWPWKYYLLIGTASELLRMAAFAYTRNELKGQITGGAVDPDAKAREYSALADRLWQEFSQWMPHAKAELNMTMSWANV